MLFTEPIFFLFFAIVFAAHWCLDSHAWRKRMLLVASYVFYGAWDWRFLFLIFASTLIDYAVGRALGRAESPGWRRAWLVLSLCANLGILGCFKYLNFFIESGNQLLGLVGMEGARTLEIILPVGISFFTFQTMSYTIDVYRRRLDVMRDFSDFALYVSFFPQLVAGPIVRASEFLPQLAVKRRLADVPFRPLLTLFLLGFIKKACVSDNVAFVVDPVFAQPGAYDAVAIWMATFYYAAQIYCDFSGYTDMAIAVAGLLGYQLPRNFNFPYFSVNIAEFWRRWHISLSFWLRDYLYISLGGNRLGPLMTYRNLMLTMLLGGLWHGAAWNFVIWGAIHGGLLAAHRRLHEVATLPAGASRVLRILGVPMTFYAVCLAWIFFRAVTLEDALLMARAYLTGVGPGDTALPWAHLLPLPALALAHYAAMRLAPTDTAAKLPPWIFTIAYAALWVAALAFVRSDARPFIYFQF